MNYIKVSIKDKNTLCLEEDGKRGDLIDLTSVTSFDGSDLEKAIEEGKDAIYQKKLKEEKEALEKAHKAELSIYEEKLKGKEEKYQADLQNAIEKTKRESSEEISSLKMALKEKDSDDKETLRNREKELEERFGKEKEDFTKRIQDLERELAVLNSSLESEKKNAKTEAENQYQARINDLNNMIALLKQEITNKEENHQKEKELAVQKKEQEIKDSFDKEREEKEKEINELKNQLTEQQRFRSMASVKVIGEDLETWCDREMTSYMQAGFQNCTWEKDNTVVKDDGEVKGSKADYIFRIYADSTHQDELSSVILDMKSESLVSTNRKANKDHFGQLAKNREKKGCKYAVLVSELEMDKTNDIPIYRVTDPAFPDMYVVRPQYMMTFLSMITSLTNRFTTLLLHVKKEDIQFQEKEVIMKNINDYRNTYLDKPLEQMMKDINDLTKYSQNIRTANDNIDKTIAHIQTSYIAGIQAKLDKFEKAIKKEVKKLPEE